MDGSELRAIPFVQLIGGEKRTVKFMTSPEVSTTALTVIEAGYQYRVANYGAELHLSVVHVATEQEVACVIVDSLSTPPVLTDAVRRLVEGFTPDEPQEDPDVYSGA